MQIERREVLRYLGYKGQEINEELDNKISEAISICEKLVQPKSIVKRYKLDKENRMLGGTTLHLKGDVIWKHLEKCSEVYLIAGTLGFDIEKRIARAFKEDATLAVILDSAATAAIESYLDDVEKSFPEKDLRWRFSCGYGDWPIEQQKEICNLLNTPKEIGVFCSSAYMLTPQKSVTAIVGIVDER